VGVLALLHNLRTYREDWDFRDSHGNGNKISHGMGMGTKCMGMGILRRGSVSVVA